MPGNMLIEEFRKIHGVRHCQSVHNQIMLQSWHDGPLAEIMVVPCLLACLHVRQCVPLMPASAPNTDRDFNLWNWYRATVYHISIENV